MKRPASLKKFILIFLLATLTISLAVLTPVTLQLQSLIDSRLSQGWILPPLEVFNYRIRLQVGQKFALENFLKEAERQNWQSGRDYVWGPTDACMARTGVALSESNLEQPATQCLWVREPQMQVGVTNDNWIVSLQAGPELQKTTSGELFPQLLAQFYGGQPILRQNTPLSDIPLLCLQAVTAIEDKDFLDHRGVSPSGILRALLRNLRSGRFAEGGSTITQQLVKNFFLNPKKTLKRKLQEQILAILLESQIGKDQILEMYLNVIYMGQSGPYQVLGFGSAAQHYFDRPIQELNLNQCATLAALINSPGRYSPFENYESSQNRRNLVLQKMIDLQMISQQDGEQVKTEALHAVRKQFDSRTAPYFILTALSEFTNLALETENGAKLFTTLDETIQNQMADVIRTELPKIEGKIKARAKTENQQPLQIAALTVNTSSGQILGLIGGRDFKQSQFNRVTDSRRQIGSIIKPFVYWPALQDKDALSPVLDEAFEWRTGNQKWRPKNYDSQTYGRVPLFFALAQSLNIAAAKMGQQVGLPNVLLALDSAGAPMDVAILPSLTLGALELSPWQVAQTYSTLSRLGEKRPLHTLTRVESDKGELLWSAKESLQAEQVLEQGTTAQLVGMMRTVFDMGTARSAKLNGLEGEWAGKTGTTSDTKDAWFVGFDSSLLTLVWIGYDDNRVMGLTGASAALPIWTELQKAFATNRQAQSFKWPEGLIEKTLTRDDLSKLYPHLKTKFPDSIKLVLPQ